MILGSESYCIIPRSVRRGGVLLVLRRVREVDLFFRRMRIGEWLGSRFHRSRRSNERLRNAGLRCRELERDLLERDRRFRVVDRERDRLFLPGERDLERLPSSLDFDLFLLAGDRDFERLFLP